MLVGRPQDRAQFDDATRIRLAEGDIDRIELAMAEQNETLRKILWAVVGLLISVTSSALVLIVTGLAGQGG